jgi:hypothetical protein
VGLDKFEFIIGRSWIYGFMKMATDFFRTSTVSFVFANCFLSFLFSASSSAILLSLELSGFVACRTHLLMVGWDTPKSLATADIVLLFVVK